MKKAEMNINTGAKAIDIIKKYSDNVIIRMSDFYPDSVGEQEFCVVNKEVFAELLRFKAIDDGIDPAMADMKNTSTVIIEVNDFYPDSKSKEQYREISREEFDRLIAEYKEKEESENRNDKVTVRVKSFVPYITATEDYADLEWKTYVAILRIKASEDYVFNPASERNTTITIRLADYFPNDTFDREYNDIGFDIYAELLKMKVLRDQRSLITESGNVRIKMADFYPDYIGDQYVEVSPAVYEQLCIERRAERKYAIRDFRYVERYGFDEIEVGERQSIYEESVEKKYFKSRKYSKLYEALNSIDPVYARRLYMHIGLGMKLIEVAELEGVTHVAIIKSIKKGLDEIRPLLSKSDFE